MVTLYAKELGEETECSCSTHYDAAFFITNPTRRMFIRPATECERCERKPEGMLQAVVAYLDRPLQELMAESDATGGGEAKIRRKTILFLTPRKDEGFPETDAAIQALVDLVEGSSVPVSVERH